MKFALSFCGVLLLLAVAFGSEINAEPLSSTPVEQTMDEELMFQNIDAVYSASKYDQKTARAPAKVSIITAEEIKRFGYRTLNDILSSLPGFYTTYDRNYGYIGVRGFSPPGDYNTKILILLDGHRLNENIYDSTIVERGFIVDTDLIERVEIVRGPGSSLYGSSAFFGVVNVITRSGRSMQGVELSASVASQESYHGRLSYGKRFTNGMELLLSGTYYDSEGNSSLYYAEYDAPDTNNGVAYKADDSQFENLFGKISFKDFTLTGAYTGIEKGVPTGSYDTFFNDSRTRTWENEAFLDLKYQRVLSRTLEFVGRFSYNWYWYDGDYVYDYGPPPDIVVNKDEAVGDWMNAEVFFTWDIHPKHRLLTGGEYRDSVNQTQKNYDIYGDYVDSKADIDSWGLFLQDEFNATDSLVFYLGARYDDSTNIDGEINPRFAVVYEPRHSTVFKFIYGKAFRAPNPYELFYEDDGETQKINPNGVQPETIASYELVGEFELNRNLRLSTSLFYNDLEDLIVLTEDPLDELLFFENLGTAEAKGVEIELYGRWESGWDFSMNYTYQKAEDGQGNWLPNSPEQMVKMNVMYPLLAQDLLSGALEVQYISGSLTYAGNKVDEAIVTNLFFTSDSILNNLTVLAGIYNLFDEKYSHPVSDAHAQEAIVQDGTTYLLKVDYSF